MTPKWLKVIEAWRAQGRRAPTLPFIYGALFDLVGSTSDNTAQAKEWFFQMLLDMESYKSDGQYLKIEKCPDLADQFVVSIEYDSQSNGPSVVYRTNGLSSIESKEALWLDLEQVLLDGRFSFNDGSYGPYLPSEIKLIHAALCSR